MTSSIAAPESLPPTPTFATAEQAHQAGLIADEDWAGRKRRVIPGAEPAARVGEIPYYRPDQTEPLKTRKAWKREGRRLPADAEPAVGVENGEGTMWLFAYSQTLSEMEYLERQRDRISETCRQWEAERQGLIRRLDAWRDALPQAHPAEAEFALRELLEQHAGLIARRLNVANAAHLLGLPLPEADDLPWRAAVVEYRQRRLAFVAAERGEEDPELVRQADRQLIETEENEAGPLHWIPFWTYYGRFHKVVEAARFEREVADATRIREFHLLFPARWIRRHFTLYLGPTNSGKTYRALKRLADAKTGCYLAPLRLLALEVADTLHQWGVPCNMITGEERIVVEGAHHTASTIEMLALQSRYEVCVIDEAQMLGDADRGWAWTQAILGAQADEVCIIGAPECRPAVEKLLKLTNDPFEVVHLERLAPLELMDKPVREFEELEPGTAIVAFSRSAVLSLKEQLEHRTGQRVAVLYGALPPEVRREQARLFADGDAPFLAATDAIGMGLNLPIRTILFAQDVKMVNRQERPLTSMEVRQIAGRAGRFGKNEVGFVGTFRISLEIIRQAYLTPPQAVEKSHLAPNLEHITAIATLEEGKRPPLAKLLAIFSQVVKPDPTVYEMSDLEDQTVLARIADRYRTLDLPTRFALAAAPVPLREFQAVAAFERMVEAVSRHQPLSLERVLPPPSRHGDNRLEALETAMRIVNLYGWLHYRFPDIFIELEEAVQQRRELNQQINLMLERRRAPKVCTACGGPLPSHFRHRVCNACWFRRGESAEERPEGQAAAPSLGRRSSAGGPPPRGAGSRIKGGGGGGAPSRSHGPRRGGSGGGRRGP
ncbi:MAG: hypothetical protein HQL51_00685 [Magnetococcales bacterium]|nr:hypothetical protein [Magnetococcales bacterium]